MRRLLYWSRAALEDGRRFIRGCAGDQRWLLWLGAGLIASGVLHLGVWAVLGGSLEGPVSWRKPIVFGLSGGVTTLALAFVVGQLPATRARGVLAKLYSITMGIEVALITLQQWRGVGSHFNQATALDSAVFTLMGILILAASVPMVVFSVGAIRARTLAADTRAALVPAVSLLLAALALGIALSVYGAVMSAQFPEADVRIIGRAGQARLSHGVALHALQVLPLLLWALRRAVADVQQRVVLLRAGAVGYVTLFFVAILQTALGRAPLDFTALTVTLVASGFALLSWPLLTALRRGGSTHAPAAAAPAALS